jgi:hypothetical protein
MKRNKESMKSNKESMKSNKPSKLGFKKLTLRVLTEPEQDQIVGGMYADPPTLTTDEWCYTV